MKLAGAVVDLLCVAGLGLPGVTVYRLWPDFVYAYSGAALLALVLCGWLLSKRSRDAS